MKAPKLPDDFTDYAEGLKRQQDAILRRAEYQKQYEEWLETTWRGRLVSFARKIGNSPFIVAIRKSFAEGENGIAFRITSLLAKISLILVVLFSLRFLAMMLQRIMGTEYEVTEEIIIERTVSSKRRGKKD